jgi:acyl-CoA synthetase (AMP-forming)/AMP-acid ligase II
MNRFDPEVYLRNIQEYKVFMLNLVPPLMVFLAKHPLVSNYDLSSVKIVSVGAAPVGKELIQEFRRRHPSVQFVAQGYGMTETTVISHFTPLSEDVPDGSCGTLISNWEAKILCLKTGKELGPNEDGEICLRSPAVMKGYFNRPDATASTVDRDGWLHTGDIGHYDENGFFFIVDRLKELIKVRGFQVPPAELEDLLLAHPKVLEAAVVGIPDEIAGEIPKAFVVPKDSSLTEEDVKRYVADQVAPYKRLKAVKFVREIPRSQAGKILRRVLRDSEAGKTVTYAKL